MEILISIVLSAGIVGGAYFLKKKEADADMQIKELSASRITKIQEWINNMLSDMKINYEIPLSGKWDDETNGAFRAIAGYEGSTGVEMIETITSKNYNKTDVNFNCFKPSDKDFPLYPGCQSKYIQAFKQSYKYGYISVAPASAFASYNENDQWDEQFSKQIEITSSRQDPETKKMITRTSYHGGFANKSDWDKWLSQRTTACPGQAKWREEYNRLIKN